MNISGSVNRVNDYYECVVEVGEGCIAAQGIEVYTSVSRMLIIMKLLGVTAELNIMYDGDGRDNRYWRYTLENGEVF